MIPSANSQTAILDRVDARKVFSAASATSDPTLAQHSALQQSGPEGCAAIQAHSPVAQAETRERVSSLDHMVSVGVLQV